jgi:hypothetical protein
MLEYWWQVELFWRLRRGEATGWTVLGDYEYPYWTACSQSKKKLAGPGAEIAATEVLLGPKTGYGACGAKWIDLALGDTPLPDREGVIAVLQHVCFSCMITLANGQKSAREVGDELARSARLLLPNRT